MKKLTIIKNFDSFINENFNEIKRATDFSREFIKNHPEFKSEVYDYYQLMLDEIENGSSIDNEISLFMNSCEDLLTDQ